MAVSRSAKVNAPHGLHARPAMLLSTLCKKHAADIRLRKAAAPAGEAAANGKNILDIMVLAADFGEVLEIEAEGLDEIEALEAVCRLLEHELSTE